MDLIGINSPQTLDYYPLADEHYKEFVYAVPSELVLDEKPDYVVILEIYGRENLLESVTFEENYQLTLKLPTDLYGSEGMLVFARRD